jgi:hypothetical protein
MTTKKVILEKVGKLVQMTKTDLTELSKQKLDALVTYYKGLLIDLIPASLGLTKSVIDSLSIEKLETLIATYNTTKDERTKEINTKVFRMNQRFNAMIKTIEYLVLNKLFVCNFTDVREIVAGFYSTQYFNLNGNEPKTFADVKTLFECGLIEAKDGRTNEPLKQLAKNSHFLTSYLYSESNKGSAKYSTRHKENSDKYNGYIATRNGANIEISKIK